MAYRGECSAYDIAVMGEKEAVHHLEMLGAASRILDTKRETMLAREFKPGFRIDLHHKDMGIAIAAARDANVSLPMTGLVAQLVAAARAQGYGSLDHSALLKVIEALSGR